MIINEGFSIASPELEIKCKNIFFSSVQIRSLEELNCEIGAMMRRLGTVWECIMCGKSSKYKNDITRHIESNHISSPGIKCDICSKISPTREALRQHNKMVHH